MKIITYFAIVLLLVSCGINTSNENSEAQDSKVTSEAETQRSSMSLEERIATIDQAIASDPTAKKLYLKKLNLYTRKSDYEGVYGVLLEMYDAKTADPYSILHLGMEHELHNKKAEALLKYNEATAAFEAVLDTMPVTKELKRNTVLMNMALAVSLSESDSNKGKLEKIMSPAEKENLAEIIATMNNLSREELIMSRRKKSQK